MNPAERFADTGYWIALANTRDALHPRARDWSQRLRARLVTTNAVLIEVADAFAGERLRAVAGALIEDVLDDPEITVVPLDRPLLLRAFSLYRARGDKDWGHTDCVSFVVMGERGIVEALAYDQHFVQAGFRALLREG